MPLVHGKAAESAIVKLTDTSLEQLPRILILRVMDGLCDDYFAADIKSHILF